MYLKFPVIILVFNVSNITAMTERDDGTSVDWTKCILCQETTSEPLQCPGACFSKVPKLFGSLSGATIPVISLQRQGSKPSNFAVLLVFLTLKACLKISYSKQADWLFGTFEKQAPGPKNDWVALGMRQSRKNWNKSALFELPTWRSYRPKNSEEISSKPFVVVACWERSR